MCFNISMATVFSMTEAMAGDEIQCPRCCSYVLYRYGKNPWESSAFSVSCADGNSHRNGPGLR